MAYTYLDVFGGAVGTGTIRDVYFVGGPSRSIQGFDLSEPKAEGHGRGIGFEVNGTNVNIQASLVGMVVNTNNLYASDWHEYYPYNGLYEWYLTIYYSTSGAGGPWQTAVNRKLMAQHQGSPPAGLGRRWRETFIEYSTSTTIPENATHIKVSVFERDRTNFSRDPIFPIEMIKPKDIKPWAIRKSGSFKTFNRPSGWFKIRKSRAWSDKSLQKEADINQVNKGVHRIRKGGSWKGQNKLGGN